MRGDKEKTKAYGPAVAERTPTIRENVEANKQHLQQSLDQLNELSSLLDKNPDAERILKIVGERYF